MESEIKVKDEPRLSSKIMKTICLVMVWISLGLCGEITGPTLLDLKLRTHSNFDAVSYGLSGRGFGFFLGSTLGGVLVDKLWTYCDLILAVAVDGNAIATLAIAWMPTTDLMFLMTFLQGIMEGAMNIAGQKLILVIWKEKAAGPLHILHGGYGIGSFIIPLIANPFLATTTMVSVTKTEYNVSTAVPGATVTTILPTSREIVVKESRMIYAYIIAAAITVVVSLFFYGYQLMGVRYRRNKEINTGEGMQDKKTLSFKQMINPATCTGGRFYYGVQLFLFVFLFYIQAEGGEVTCGKFIRTYAIKHLDFSEDDGSYINTIFWVTFTIGRFTGLLTARFIPIRILVMLETGSCLVISILLLIFGERSMPFWILITTLGFCIAPLYPSGIGWANYHIDVTGVAITFFMLGGSIGNFGYIRLTGYLFDQYGYKSFLYVLLGFAIACFIMASLMNVVAIQNGDRFDPNKVQNDLEIDQNTDDGDSEFDNEGYQKDDVTVNNTK